MTLINENLFIAIPVLTLFWSSIDLRVRFIFFSYADLLSSYMFTFFFFLAFNLVCVLSKLLVFSKYAIFSITSRFLQVQTSLPEILFLIFFVW